MDILYVFKKDPENNSEELRYSLRSLVNLPHDRVFIAGEKPDWVTNCEFIPVPQSDTKYRNVHNNILAACNDQELSQDFIFMNDDMFIMKSVDKIADFHMGLLRDVIRWYRKRYPGGSDYVARLEESYDLLTNMDIKAPLCYELHVPMIMNKMRALGILEFDESAQRRTMYGNIYARDGGTSVMIKDPKVFADNTHNDPEYVKSPMDYLLKQTFLSMTGGTFKRGLPGDFVREKFTKKSIYER